MNINNCDGFLMDGRELQACEKGRVAPDLSSDNYGTDKTRLIAVMPTQPRNSHFLPEVDLSRGWEYKICITATDSTSIQAPFPNTLCRRGWEFVSESNGIFHFKRLKRQCCF